MTQVNWEIGHLIDTEVLQERWTGDALESLATLSQHLSCGHCSARTAQRPKLELERRIAQIYRAAQEQVARPELGSGRDDEDD